MATSKDVYRLDSMSVAATASVTLTGWKTSAGGTRNAVASVNVSQSFNSGQSFGMVSVGGVAVPYFALVTPDYKDATTGASVSLSNPPILYVCSTNNGDTTSDKAFANNTTSVRIVISRSSDGSGGTASASGSGSVSYVSTKLYTETTYTRTVARANVGSKNCGKVEPATAGKVVFHDGVYYSGSDYTAKATAFLDSAVSPNLPGYFIGWTGDVEEEGVTVDSYTYQGGQLHALKTVAKDLSFTAHFAPKLALVYAKNDGGGETASHPFPKATQWNLPANTFTREGYTFTGWRKDDPSSGDEYADEAQAEFSANCTLYAQWELIEGHSLVADAKCGQTALGVQVSVAPAENAVEGGWVEGTQMTATAPAVIEDAAGNVQYVFVAWTASANVELPSPATDAEVEFDMPDSDATLTASYALKTLDVRAEVHSASADKVTASRTLTRGGETVQGDACYGDVATFTASDISSGYEFAGWYDESDQLVSSSTQCNVVLRKDIALRAKLKTAVSVAWGKFTSGTMGPDTDSHGTLHLEDMSAPKSVTGKFVLGSEVEVGYSLPADDTGSFGGWFKGNNRITLDSLGDGRFRHTVTEPVALYATYATSKTYYYVSLHAEDVNQDVDSNLGDFAMRSLEGGEVVEMAESDWMSESGIEHPHGDGRFYKVEGMQSVKVLVYMTGSVPYSAYRWQSYSISGSPSSPVAMNAVAEITKTIDENCFLAVTFAEKTSRTVTAQHESNDVGVIARGTLDLVDAKDVSRDPDGYSVSGRYDDGATATVVARPANGFKFAGWYSGGNKVSSDALYEFVLDGANATLTAKFEEDSMGIMLWEGSDENMEMEWTSKVYVAPKPFDPVAARIDATGYPEPVQLSVGTFSSPNVAPDAAHKEPITVASQGGRRLSRMRPERFVRFTVKASHEIDAVVIGTNMAEVN